MDPLTMAMLGMGGIGALGSIFGRGDPGPFPDFSMSPEAMKQLSYSGINLERENPELYREIMRNNQMISDAQQILNSRRQGPSPQEQRMMQERQAGAASQMASAGMAGTPLSQLAMQEMDIRGQQAAQERAFQESMGMQQNIQGLAGRGYDMRRGAMQDVMGAQAGNRQNALMMDQARMAHQMAQYQNAQQEAQAKNQMWTGIMGAGFGGAANLYGAGKMADAYAARPAPTYNIYGGFPGKTMGA